MKITRFLKALASTTLMPYAFGLIPACTVRILVAFFKEGGYSYFPDALGVLHGFLLAFGWNILLLIILLPMLFVIGGDYREGGPDFINLLFYFVFFIVGLLTGFKA
ncbi:MAG: hypothetical protein DM484_04840 [Candidatus Methylumidiphilus alinenensis]|uniref:Uncharacterized protein n=1 Tax=Candidatus Methylumidiphilus alinenensis TaxID=2202197 RepID=A0A2W4RJR3_9GAMM|nr:MAG: hypothetical protein DM484_04840 [Candidatus Methylumidiphilus alinenensis]